MKTRRILSLLLALMLILAGCTPAKPAEKPVEEPAVETTETTETTETATEETTEPAVEDDGYTSLDDFVLFDENNQLMRTGRGDTGENGVVASGKYEASKIGKEIIEAGGNAVDAAVAVGFALSLVEPNATGIGGGGFMTMHSASGETIFLNFREKAPQAATPDMWSTFENEEGKEVVVGNQKILGGKSVGVPGNVAGWLYALENYGTMSREEVLAPVIELARKGITVTPTLATDMSGEYDNLMLYSESGDIFLKEVDGIKFPYEIGETFKNEDFAKTLELIAKDGKAAFYEGPIAQAMVQTVNKYGGLFSMEDLANYEVEVLEPVHTNYRGYDIYSSPSPSSGGTIVAEILNIVENFDLPSMAPDSPERLHIFADAFSMAYADRAEYMGDVKFVEVPVAGLLSKDYAKKLSEKIQTDAAITEPMPDDPWMFEHEDTTHYSVVDKEGNIVSLTSTVNYYFGSKVGIPGYGFVMNNEMDDFVTGHDHPNSIAGGKTPLSSMSPTIILKDGKPVAALGSPGGTTIISTVAQVISNLVDHDMNMQDAVDFPRIKGFKEGKITYEDRLPAETITRLEEIGHTMEASDEWDRSFGSVNAVLYNEDGTLEGAGDPRRDGKALGF
ncbi:MAG: gamma-glutamyltransferase [Tissierellia bacterium]|jgi:gamma-glutamyltranspeptidase/glutathione hydrolase|nr:gamma-glutamyltransferase [Tissierellia bacterium]